MKSIFVFIAISIGLTLQAIAAGTYFRKTTADIALPHVLSGTSPQVTILSLNVPGGVWEIQAIAKTQGDEDGGFNIAYCDITVGGSNFLSSGGASPNPGNYTYTGQFVMSGAVKTAGAATAIVLSCRGDPNARDENILAGTTLLVRTTPALK